MTAPPTLVAPGSKSVAQRALLLASLSDTATTLTGLTLCDDVAAALRLVRALGCEIIRCDDMLTVVPGAGPRQPECDVGESATTLRMGAAVAGIGPEPLLLLPRGTLRCRPHEMVGRALEPFGVDVEEAARGLWVRGPLRPPRDRRVHLDGSVTSQHISGLMLALPRLDRATTVQVSHPVSVGYLKLTADVASAFGVGIHVADDGSEIRISGGVRPRCARYRVEGDWSAAAFLLVAGAVSGGVTVEGLRHDSLQADRAVLAALREAGAGVSAEPDRITVRPAQLRAFALDASHAPDAIPPLIALATACDGTSVIHGARRLVAKESNRGVVLQRELGRLGADIQVTGDVITIVGSALSSGRVDVHGDHRIAMAAAVCGLRVGGRIDISDPGCVAKSYPHFFADLERMRA